MDDSSRYDEDRFGVYKITKLRRYCVNRCSVVVHRELKPIWNWLVTLQRRRTLTVHVAAAPTMCFYLFLASLVLLEISPFTEGSHCESVKIPLCRNMPYNRTRMPNLMHHSTQENAILAVEQYELLAKTSCSDMLVFYLCSLYAPICTGMDFQTDAVPPCRSVCQQVRSDCEPLLNRYNVSWPAAFDCSELPQYDRGVCITPDAIIADGSGSGLSTKASSKIKSGESFCRCKPVVVPTRKLYVAKRFDYVIKCKVKTVEVIGELTIAQVQVMQVLKWNRVQVYPRAVSMLWTVSGCACPALVSQTVYLIMGHDDPSNNRLLFDERAIAVPWKKGYVKKVQKWERHLLRRQKLRGKSGNGKAKSSPNADGSQTAKIKDGTKARKRPKQGQPKGSTKAPGITTLRPNKRNIMTASEKA